MLLTPWLAALKVRLDSADTHASLESSCGCLSPACCGRRAWTLFCKQSKPAVVPMHVTREHSCRARQRLA
jgi:hypothetical protein